MIKKYLFRLILREIVHTKNKNRATFTEFRAGLNCRETADLVFSKLMLCLFHFTEKSFQSYTIETVT